MPVIQLRGICQVIYVYELCHIVNWRPNVSKGQWLTMKYSCCNTLGKIPSRDLDQRAFATEFHRMTWHTFYSCCCLLWWPVSYFVTYKPCILGTLVGHTHTLMYLWWACDAIRHDWGLWITGQWSWNENRSWRLSGKRKECLGLFKTVEILNLYKSRNRVGDITNTKDWC